MRQKLSKWQIKKFHQNDIFVSVYKEVPFRHIRGPSLALQWRHNGRDSVSNNQPHHCFLNRVFRHRSKKTSKLRVTGLCVGNSPEVGEFPAQMASNAFDDVITGMHALSYHAYEKNTPTPVYDIQFYSYTVHVAVIYTIWFIWHMQNILSSPKTTTMTSSNGNIFRVTGPLCGKFIGDRWIPRTKASEAELWCFLWSTPE